MQFISHKVFDLFNKFRIHVDLNIGHGIAENNWQSTNLISLDTYLSGISKLESLSSLLDLAYLMLYLRSEQGGIHSH